MLSFGCPPLQAHNTRHRLSWLYHLVKQRTLLDLGAVTRRDDKGVQVVVSGRRQSHPQVAR